MGCSPPTPKHKCRPQGGDQVDEIRWRTILASLRESWIVPIVLGELSMGSPRKRIAAISEAAINNAPL